MASSSWGAKLQLLLRQLVGCHVSLCGGSSVRPWMQKKLIERICIFPARKAGWGECLRFCTSAVTSTHEAKQAGVCQQTYANKPTEHGYGPTFCTQLRWGSSMIKLPTKANYYPETKMEIQSNSTNKAEYGNHWQPQLWYQWTPVYPLVN